MKISSKMEKVISYLLLASYMAVIFYLSSIPLHLPEIPWDPTKFTLHFIEYMLLGFLSSNAFRDKRKAFLLSSIYGISDEIHQSFVPTRTFSFSDIFADILGSIVGVEINYFLLRRTKFGVAG